MSGVYSHLLRKVFRFHETILSFGEPGSLGTEKLHSTVKLVHLGLGRFRLLDLARKIRNFKAIGSLPPSLARFVVSEDLFFQDEKRNLGFFHTMPEKSIKNYPYFRRLAFSEPTCLVFMLFLVWVCSKSPRHGDHGSIFWGDGLKRCFFTLPETNSKRPWK